MAPYRFFSFVVPAHNEEKIIERTITCLSSLDYPKDRYESIIIENGSTDATYTKAKKFETPNTKIYSHLPKGVSRARNFGLTQCSSAMDWCIFMDADVFLKQGFLKELNTYLYEHPSVGYGTTTVLLDDETMMGRFWSFFNNFFYRMFKVLFTIHVVRKDIAMRISYDENLVSGEDIVYGRDAVRYGKYFFMKSLSVATSARRFKRRGYIKMFFVNMYHGILCFILPERLLQKVDWEVIR